MAILESVTDIRVVAAVRLGSEAARVVRSVQPDVLVSALELNGGKIDWQRVLDRGGTRMIVLDSSEDQGRLVDWIAAGASGYLLDNVQKRELLHAVRKVVRGQAVIQAALTATLFGWVRGRGPKPDGKLLRLSCQERKVLDLLAEGETNLEISKALHLAEKTVKNYVSSILSKLELPRRSAAVAYYWKARQSVDL